MNLQDGLPATPRSRPRAQESKAVKVTMDDEGSNDSVDVPSKTSGHRIAHSKSFQRPVPSSCHQYNDVSAVDDILSKELQKYDRRHKDEMADLAKVKFPDIRRKEKHLHNTIALLEEMQGFKNWSRIRQNDVHLRRSNHHRIDSKETLHNREHSLSKLSSLASITKQ